MRRLFLIMLILLLGITVKAQSIIALQEVDCYGNSTGQLLADTGGWGTGPYNYFWNTGDLTQTISSLSSGSYNVTVTDALFSTLILSYYLGEPAPIVATPTVVHNVCYGQSNGSITLDLNGGRPPFTVSWTGPGGFTSALQNIGSLASGDYAFTVTDSYFCTTTGTVRVEPQAGIQGYITPTHVTCNGGNNGSALAIFSGGSGPLQYAWSGGQTTPAITGLTAGNYTLTVTDSLGCQAFDNITITQPAAALSLVTTLVTNVTICYGNSNGAINMTTAGGTSPYSYFWLRDGFPFPAVTEDLSNIPAGVYSVTVTDAAGCQTVVSNINVTEPGQTTFSEGYVDILCAGGNNGIWSIIPTGSTGPYTFTFNTVPPGAPFNVPGVISGNPAAYTNLTAGTYTCTVTDVNTCTWSFSHTFAEPPPIASFAVVQHNGCYGEANGSIDLSVSGGNPPYNYSWTGPGGFTAATQDISNLVSGDYSVVITDASLCTAALTAQLNQGQAIQGYVTTTPVSCNGGSDGGVQAIYSGGSGTFQYTWSGGQNTPVVTGLSAGTYYLTITDSAGCQALDTAIVSQPSTPLTFFTLLVIPVIVCHGDSTGSIDMFTDGGTPPYSYIWWRDGYVYPSVAEDPANMPAGFYSVVVTDANGCTESQSNIFVSEPDLPVFTHIPVNISCNNGSDGQWQIIPSGTTGPYDFTFNTVPPTALFTVNGVLTGDTAIYNNLAVGIYTCDITDANGCSYSFSHEFLQPLPIVILPTVSDNACFGDTIGSISLQVNGGSPGYSFSWTGPDGYTSVDQNIIALAAGIYDVTVTDTNMCTSTLSVPVGEGMLIQGYISSIDVNCYGGADGSAEAIYSGGTGILSYVWSTTDTTAFIGGLNSSTYYLTISDEAGCVHFDSVFIAEPAELTVVADSLVDVTICHGYANGAIFTTVAGGTAPYTYVWLLNGILFPQITEDISNIPAGNYTLIVTDAHGCSASAANLIISEPDETVITQSFTAISCNNGGDGAWTLIASGTTGPYSFSFNTVPPGVPAVIAPLNSGDPAVYANLIAGTYTCEVTDANGCTWNFSHTFDQPLPFVVQPVVQHNVCYEDNAGAISMQVNGGNPLPSYTVNWTGPGGFTSSSFTLTGLASGDYFYIVTDGNGCTDTGQVRIEPQLPLQGYIAGQDVTCYGGNDGIATAIFSGGSGFLAYLWSTGATTPQISTLTAGTYTITVTDSAGCVRSDTVIINQPPEIIITLNAITHVSCFGYNDGFIATTISGGTPPYTITWLHDNILFSQVTDDIINLYAGTYTIIVEDDIGCSASASFTVLQPLPTIFFDTVHPISCNNGADGFWSIMPMGIDTAYVAIFSTGDTISTDTVPAPYINGLAAGSYSCVITGSNGCEYYFHLVLTQPQPIVVGLVDIEPVICYGDSTGSITLDDIHGGNGPYTYLWSNGAITNPAVGLQAGYYSVTVSDSLNCPVYQTYLVDGPYEPIKFFPTIVGTSCLTASDGKVIVYDYDVYWSPYQNFFILYDSLGNVIDTLNMGEWSGDLPFGTYIGTIVNEFGCFTTDTFYVYRGQEDCILIPNLITPNGDGFNDVFEVVGGCEYDEFKVIIFTDDGLSIFESEECTFQWDPLKNFKIWSNTVFYYYIRVAKGEMVWEYRNSINVNY